MKKKLLSMICAICTICMLVPMTISAEIYGDFEYSKSEKTNEVIITNYKGTGGNVVIPSEIEGIPVTTIGERAFDRSGITSVIIPNSVTTIENSAFRSTNLTSVTIPGSVKNIGTSTFAFCGSLSDVTIENGVESIGISAFLNCSSLININIPDSVVSIDNTAFTGCTSLKNIQVGALNSVYSSVDGILFNKNQTELIRYPRGTTETSYRIPGTVTSIGRNAFRGTNLTSVTIPGSVENIGTSAFGDCSSLSDVTIENGVESIGTCAFQNCSSLININIPDSVVSIDNTAFNGCTSLKNIQVEALNSVYSSVDGILFNRNQTELIRCPQGIAEASYSIPGTVTSIGNYAFFGCDKLTNITIPNSVTSIGNSAFGYCEFTSITIPNSVTFIGSNAFENCINLVSIFLPDNLNIGHVVIPLETTQVRYSIDKDQVTITEITLGLEKSSVDIPATICGYPVVAVNSDYQKFVGDHKHYYAWTVQDGKYSGKCGICSKTIEEKDIPAIVINAPDQVCRTQDTVVSVSVPDGISTATLNYDFSHIGNSLDTTIENGKLEGVLHSSGYLNGEDSFNVKVTVTTSDGYIFDTIKTVEILNNHKLKHISAKEATVTEEGNIEYWKCKVCEKYFSDKDGENEIELKDTVVSRKAPEIIEGKGQSVNQGEKKSLSFTSNAPFNEFKYVKLDGKVLDSKNYTVKEGSTIVTLNKDFVSTLKAGKHILTIVSETGEASVEFIVNKTSTAKPSKNTTNTGLVSNIGLWISLMFTSLDAMCIGLICRKRNMK